jgi:hypothetical protein
MSRYIVVTRTVMIETELVLRIKKKLFKKLLMVMCYKDKVKENHES